MENLQVPFFLFLFFSVVQSKNHCPTSYCHNNSFPIQYPFKLQYQHPPQHCNYTNLTCDSQGITILNLPYSGDFHVRSVDYDSSIIKLYDPENCLPRRFMNFSLLTSNVFSAIYSRNFTFYSCPSKFIALSNFTSINCLSNSSRATVATHSISSQVMTELYRCNAIVTSEVPVSRMDLYDFIGNQSDFILTWSAPPCKYCPREKGFMVPENILVAAFMMIYFLTFIMPILVCIACCVSCTQMVRSEVKAKNSNIAT